MGRLDVVSPQMHFPMISIIGVTSTGTLSVVHSEARKLPSPGQDEQLLCKSIIVILRLGTSKMLYLKTYGSTVRLNRNKLGLASVDWPFSGLSCMESAASVRCTAVAGLAPYLL